MGRHLLLVLAAAAALASSVAPAAAQRCPGGRFVATDPNHPDFDPLLVVIADDERPLAITGCGIVKPRKPTTKWPLRAKLADCSGRPRKATLKGAWSLDCGEIMLQLRGKKLRRDLVAEPSVCGDGVVDGERDEQCERPADCGVGGHCYAGCSCEPPTTTTLASTTSTIVTGSSSTTTTSTLPGEAPLLAPGDVVTDTKARAETPVFRIELDDPALVFLRAAEITTQHAAPCLQAFDENGDPAMEKECNSIALALPHALPAGDLTLEVTWTRTGEYVLQYLPLTPAAVEPTPVGPDATVETELPGPGLLRVHRLSLSTPRRVFVRLTDLGAPAVFAPCIQVLAEGQDPADAEFRCTDQAPVIDLTLPAGDHYVVVSDRFHDSAGAYRLRVPQLDPAFAPALTGATQCKTLNDRDDLDLFRFTVAASETPVSIELEENGTNPAGYTPCLRVWKGQDGPAIFDPTDCSGAVTVERELDAGTYYVGVHDDSRTTPGGYCLTRQ